MEEKDTKKQYDHMETARIIGEPKDPLKPYPDIISLICETFSAEPEDYIYHHLAYLNTDKVYIITATGLVTQQNVVPRTPTLLTPFDIVTPEYYIKWTDYLSRKENVLGRHKFVIGRSLDAYESYKVISLIDTAVSAANSFDLTDFSGATRWNYEILVTMINQVIDYGDTPVLIMGKNIDLQTRLWDWHDNKYTSLAMALKELNVKLVRQVGELDVDNSSGVDIIDPDVCYLVMTSTVMGKPVLWGRKKMDSVKNAAGVIAEDGDSPERIIVATPQPIQVGSTNKYYAIGLSGYEEAYAAVTNYRAIAKFNLTP